MAVAFGKFLGYLVPSLGDGNILLGSADGFKITAAQLVGIVLIIFQNIIAQNKAHNPIIFADVPDMSIIRVGDTYYMSSTTMHLSPGLPIMSSKDLVNWKIIGYCYDTLVSNDDMNLENGKSTYGRGSWASSIRYHNGTYYFSTFSATSGKTHIYSTKNIEKGPWKAVSFRPSLHDQSTLRNTQILQCNSSFPGAGKFIGTMNNNSTHTATGPCNVKEIIFTVYFK